LLLLIKGWLLSHSFFFRHPFSYAHTTHNSHTPTHTQHTSSHLLVLFLSIAIDVGAAATGSAKFKKIEITIFFSVSHSLIHLTLMQLFFVFSPFIQPSPNHLIFYPNAIYHLIRVDVGMLWWGLGSSAGSTTFRLPQGSIGCFFNFFFYSF